ncbi:MAG: chorismate mutase [Rhodospirillaceae bacterium]|jgi:chorismate mutase / prephenate dehydratase|nr:chorismate mutase [Rhodospirillaceae bacterium]MBT5013636.1 chorismate mutase [Rhodospirillaceae bacterium]MBT5308781.1 chorismate mutase [Rhodospirillaceae bacterium]MBT6406591.1 chorismate mutase [Rhodospirillaceae bacterium]MBT7355210.1 chorismate mutase [Rhodospirillaceae bacterium]
MAKKPSLDDLRREIDAIDDQLHDLFMARTEIVKQVREVKRGQPVKIRPAREDRILYRLIERHRGPFPKREIARIWREVIVATLSFEGPFSVAVHMPESEPSQTQADERRTGLWNMARDQYGSFTQMTGHVSRQRVIEAVKNQDVTVGVLPVPGRDDADPWWVHLASDMDGTPKVIARLPFAGSPNGRGGDMQALVICPVMHEPSSDDGSRDRTYLIVETDTEVGLDRLTAAMNKADLNVCFSSVAQNPEVPSKWLHLVEVEGFVTEDERRIGRLSEALGEKPLRILSMGGYGTALTDKELS